MAHDMQMNKQSVKSKCRRVITNWKTKHYNFGEICELLHIRIFRDNHNKIHKQISDTMVSIKVRINVDIIDQIDRSKSMLQYANIVYICYLTLIRSVNVYMWIWFGGP